MFRIKRALLDPRLGLIPSETSSQEKKKIQTRFHIAITFLDNYFGFLDRKGKIHFTKATLIALK